MPETPQPALDSLSFEAAIARLESLLQRMDDQRMPLEELIVAYEEGSQLVNVCKARLAQAAQQIEIIQRRTRDAVQTKPYTPPAKQKSFTTRTADDDVPPF